MKWSLLNCARVIVFWIERSETEVIKIYSKSSNQFNICDNFQQSKKSINQKRKG